MKTTEVYILGGFLGSGKTTLLQHIIREEKVAGRKIAVLVNELGSISIDSAIIKKEGVPYTELFDGCICCTISEKLEAQLQGLLSSNDLDAIYIETTGAAHPVEVVDSIMSPLLVHQIQYKGIITVVDLSRWKDRRELSPQIRQLMIEQIKHADIILLNKADKVIEEEQGSALFEIQTLNNKAFCVFTNHCKVPLQTLQKQKIHNIKSEKGIKHTIESLQLQTILYTFQQSVKYELFENWLKSLPDTVFRIKGYVRFTHSQYPYLFQYSYGTPVMLQELMNMPLNLVIIGKELDQELIREQLQQLESNQE